MSLIIGGKQIVIPGVVPEVDASEMTPLVLGSARLPLVLGVSDGGVSGKVYVFRSMDEAREVIRAGTVLSYIARLFRPSPTLPGASRVLFIRVNASAPAYYSPSNAPMFTINLSPVSQEITLDGVTRAVINGTITRVAGFDEDIRLNIPGSFASEGNFGGQFQDTDNTVDFSELQALGHNTYSPVGDSFTVEIWANETGWAAYGSYWTDFHFFGVSSETALTVPSNDATIVLPPEPDFDVVVTPAASVVQFVGGSQVDAPLVLTVNIIRRDGFNEPVNIELPLMQGSWDGWEAVVNGITLPAEAEFEQHVVSDAPDTFTCEFSGTGGGFSLVNWVSPGGVRFIGVSASFPNVPSNLVTVDTENI